MKPLLRCVLASALLLVGACSTGPQPQPEDYPEPVFSAERVLPDNYDLIPIYDPWRIYNLHIYNFNYRFDHAVFLPVLRGYEAVMPGFAKAGISNFYKNIKDVTTMVNSVLQLSPKKFLQSTSRVLVNSTVGLLGLVDVASRMDIPRPQEDLGQTLGVWGVGPGPYLVLPFLGPSNLRDGLGKLPDFYLEFQVQGLIMSDTQLRVSTLVEGIDLRARTPFRYYESGFAFEYRMLRWLYATQRDLDISK